MAILTISYLQEIFSPFYFDKLSCQSQIISFLESFAKTAYQLSSLENEVC